MADICDQTLLGKNELLDAVQHFIKRSCQLTNFANIASDSSKRKMDSLAQTLNVQAQYLDVRRPDELDAALMAAKTQIQGIVVTDEQTISVGDSPRRIADFALMNRLPSIGPEQYPQVGGLMGYGVDWPDVVRRSMAFVDKILKGAKPADLPIQQATKFELVINLKTAKALGLTIPPSLLQRADQVIE